MNEQAQISPTDQLINKSTDQRFTYILHLADNALIHAQRNAEWCGHGPVLEQDIAITNISLDALGAARNLYQYAADLYNGMPPEAQAAAAPLLPRPWRDFGRELNEDDLAFLREERQYLNLLLTELPKGDWAVTVLRQFFISQFQLLQYRAMETGPDERLQGIAAKAVKETAYHLRWSAEWVIRLGDGTEESSRRMQAALQLLWPYTGELFKAAPWESPDPALFEADWTEGVREVFAEAGLDLPPAGWSQEGGKWGRHTEHLGYLLTDMQYLQRTYPNAVW